jgi:DNA-directed RNA polymerase subunit RPC12/RpoP
MNHTTHVVRNWVARTYNLAADVANKFRPESPPCCNGCARAYADVDRLVSGPRVYICSDCNRDAANRLDTSGRCTFCGKKTLVAHLHADRSVAICGGCVALVDHIIRESELQN